MQYSAKNIFGYGHKLHMTQQESIKLLIEELTSRTSINCPDCKKQRQFLMPCHKAEYKRCSHGLKQLTKLFLQKRKKIKDQNQVIIYQEKEIKAQLERNAILQNQKVSCQKIIAQKNGQIQLLKKQILMSKKLANESEGLCKICLDKKAIFCMASCGHVCMCEDHYNFEQCPICRAQGQPIRIYASLLHQ